MKREDFEQLENDAKRKALLSLVDGLELNFTGYYKYTFSYEGSKVTPSGVVTIVAAYGSDADEIYREEFGPTHVFYERDLEYNEDSIVIEVYLDGVKI